MRALGVVGIGALFGVGLMAGCAANVSAGANGPTQVQTQSGAPNSGPATTPGQVGGGQAYQSTGGGSCPTSATDPAIAKLRGVTTESVLPKGFNAVAAVRCSIEQHAVPGDGTWQFDVAQRASSGPGLADFLRLLQQPNESTPTNEQIACPADLLVLPDFGLVGSDGTVIRPKLPLTVCGQPLPNVLTALSALPWKTETETKVTQLQTQAEIDSGCPSGYKYLPGLGLGGAPIPWSQVRHPPMASVSVVCVFRVDYAVHPVAEGRFVSGYVLTAAQGTAAQAAVDAASPAPTAPPCMAKATRFAMLGGRDDPLYLLELDGCHRLVFPNLYLATGPSGLYSLLAQVGIK